MGKLANLARVSTSTTGTGTVTLGAAISGYLTFALAGIANGDVVSYGILDGSNSEVGEGTYSSTGPTLTRGPTTSTNSNAAISLSGTAQVFITPRAEDLLSFSTAQVRSDTEKATGRGNVYAAPFDALAYNGMQVNGSCDVSQESGTASVVVPSGFTQLYVMDGFQSARTGTGAWSIQQVASVFPGYNNELKLTVTTAQPTIGTDSGVIQNIIEGYRFQRAMWGTASAVPVTVGCWVKSSVAGSLVMDILNSAFDSSSVTTPVTIAANTLTWCTWVFPAVTTGTWLKTNGIGARVRLSVMNPTVSFNISATLGNTLETTGWVILPGTELPTAARAPLIMRPYGQELYLCRQQYQFVNVVGDFNATATSQNSAFAVQFDPEMRVIPSLSLLTPVGTSGVGSTAFFTTTARGSFFQMFAASAARAFYYGVAVADARL
jgi:hypothetical protein